MARRVMDEFVLARAGDALEELAAAGVVVVDAVVAAVARATRPTPARRAGSRNVPRRARPGAKSRRPKRSETSRRP